MESIETVLSEWDSIETVEELDDFENRYLKTKKLEESFIPEAGETVEEQNIMITHIVGPEADRVCEEAIGYLGENKNITVYQNIKRFSLDNRSVHIAILSYRSGN